METQNAVLTTPQENFEKTAENFPLKVRESSKIKFPENVTLDT